MKLKVGGYYRSRNRDVYGPIKADDRSKKYPYTADGLYWTQQGNYWDDGRADSRDLIEEVLNPNQADRIAELEEECARAWGDLKDMVFERDALKARVEELEAQVTQMYDSGHELYKCTQERDELRTQLAEAEAGHDQLYADYQDAAKWMFEYKDRLDEANEKLHKTEMSLEWYKLYHHEHITAQTPSAPTIVKTTYAAITMDGKIHACFQILRRDYYRDGKVVATLEKVGEK